MMYDDWDEENTEKLNERERLVEDDEMTPEEAAFMEGYDEAF